jgi:hypothetical protein
MGFKERLRRSYDVGVIGDGCGDVSFFAFGILAQSG